MTKPRMNTQYDAAQAPISETKDRTQREDSQLKLSYSAEEALRQMANFKPAIPLQYIMASRRAAKLKNS